MICNVVESLQNLLVEISTLQFDPKNARKHGEKNLEAIKSSLRKFGQRMPIVVQKDGMVVRAGNGRLQSAKELGWTHIAAVIVDESDVDAVAFAITDNRTSELAEWNSDVLVDHLKDLVGDEYNMVPFGWDSEELGSLIEEPRTIFDQVIDVNETDLSTVQEIETPDIEEGEEVVTQPGDLIVLGPHRVLCGDSTSLSNYDRLLGNRLMDICFTDPPYNMAYSSAGFHRNNPLIHMTGITSDRSKWVDKLDELDDHVNSKRFTKRNIENDFLSSTSWSSFVSDFSKIISKKVVGDCYFWTTWKSSGYDLLSALEQEGFNHGNTIVWAKNTHVLSPSKYQRKHEFCLYGWFGKKSSWHGDRTQTDVWNFDRPHKSEFHPTMKPISLCSLGIRNSSAKGQTVFDPFLGSGSTLLACEQLDRICYGMELEPKYCDVIVNRWENLTGQKVERISVGKDL